MPHNERTPPVGWDGNLARGAGTLDAVSGAFARLPFSLASRVGDPGGKTSPEELLAAAHGGCLTMSLAGELTSATRSRSSTPPTATPTSAVRCDVLLHSSGCSELT